MHIPKTQSALRERIDVLTNRIQKLNDMAAFRADQFDPGKASRVLVLCTKELDIIGNELHHCINHHKSGPFGRSGDMLASIPRLPFSSTGQPDTGPGEPIISKEGRFVSGLIPGANQGSKIDIPPKTFGELTEAIKRSANADRRFLKDGESEI